jgi:hypothetical protein
VLPKLDMGRRRRDLPSKESRRANRAGPAARQFNRLLAPLGMRLLPVPGDGNCFFRACAVQFQILGRNHAPRDICDHMKLRQRVCDYLCENRKVYAPYLEAEALGTGCNAVVDFDGYVKKMRVDGVWAGHLEVHALSAMLESEMIIYLLDAPSYRIRHSDGPVQRVLRLAYYENQHYDAVLPTDIQHPGASTDMATSHVPSSSRIRDARSRKSRRGSARSPGMRSLPSMPSSSHETDLRLVEL